MTTTQPLVKLRAPSLSEILPRLYLGDYHAAINKTELARLGITDMLTVEIKKLKQAEVSPSVQRYLHLNIMDHPKQDIMSYFEVSNDFIDTALKNPDNRVFVHCVAGISRSATLVSAYIMKSQSLSYKKALEFVKSKRPIIDPNEGFIRQLALFERMNFKILIDNIEYRSMILEALVLNFRFLASHQQEKKVSIKTLIKTMPPLPTEHIHRDNIKKSISILIDQYFEKLFLKSTDKKPQIYKPEKAYKCAKCRSIVFYDVNIIENKELSSPTLPIQIDVPTGSINSTKSISSLANTVSDSASQANNNIRLAAGKPCAFLFIEPQPWMLDSILAIKGQINCYKCDKKLGKFDWESNESCSCSLHTSHMNMNLFKIVKKNVDSPPEVAT